MQMLTIGLADGYGLPVSRIYVLSSGVVRATAANGAELRWAAIKNMALAWLMALPAPTIIGSSLLVIFCEVF